MNPYARTFEGNITSTATPAVTLPAAEHEDGYHGDIGIGHEEGDAEAWEDGDGSHYWEEQGHHHAGYASSSFGYHPQAYGYEQQTNGGGVIVAGGGAPSPPRDGWMELRRVYEDRAAVTAVEFDPFEELLWAGHSDGRLTSYLQPEMTKHSSVAAHKHRPHGVARRGEPSNGPDGSIHDLVLLQDGVLSVSSSAVRLHSRGCLPRATLSGLVEVPRARGIPSTSHMIENLTCCALNAPSTVMGGMGAPSSSHVTVGTLGGDGGGGIGFDSPPRLLQLDPLSDLRLLKDVELPKEAGVTAMARGTMLAVGCNDGHIRLFDLRLRSAAVEHVLTAHTGPVQALAVTPTDGLKMVSVGMKSKSLNPYDASAPTELFADPVVRVFDARMPGRAAPPLQFSMLGAPRLVRFLADESLVLVSSTGQFLLSKEPFTETPRLDFFHVTDAQGAGEGLTSIAVASSGDGIALGSASGACIQMGQGGGRDVRSNLSSRPVERPERPSPPPPPPEASVNPLDETPPASKYVMRQATSKASPLSSSFASTPKLLRAVLRRPPPRRPATGLLEKATWRDYLGVIPNPGHVPNSLLFGKGKESAYEVVDPRRRTDKETPAFERRTRGSLGGTTAAMRAMGLEDVPRRYRRPILNLGRRGFDGFDFARYNNTEYAGLENAHAHTYVNSILQALFFVPEVREAALREQYNPIHYAPLSGRTTSGLSCELGFLFQQLERAREVDPKQRSCQATNFLRAFKEVPEVLALGLLEDPQNARAIGLPRKAEALHRFLLSQLDKEAKEPDIPFPRAAPPPPKLANAGVAGARAKDSATVSKVAGGSKQEGNAATEDGTPAEPGPDGPSLRDAEDRTTASSPASVSSGRGRGGGIGGKVRSTVDRLYGYGTRTSNAFLHEKIPTKTIDVKHTRTLVTEMIPVDHPGHAAPAKYFADVLARSLCRETRARAWRDEIGAYAPIRQKRCPVSLPEVMPIHCAAAMESSDATREAFRSKNCRGGPWLPREVEISLVQGGDGEVTVVVGEAADPPARWMRELEAAERAEAARAASAAGAGAGSGNDSANVEEGGRTVLPDGDGDGVMGGGKHRKGWYFASPLPGKDGAGAIAAVEAKETADARKGLAPPEEKEGRGKEEEKDNRSEDEGACHRWMKGGIARYRYRLMEVVSRVVPATRTKGVGEKAVAGSTAAGSTAAGSTAAGSTAAGSTAAAASGEAGRAVAEDDHLVLHVRAPTAEPALTIPGRKLDTPPRVGPCPRGGGDGDNAGNLVDSGGKCQGDDASASSTSGGGTSGVGTSGSENTKGEGEKRDGAETEVTDGDRDGGVEAGGDDGSGGVVAPPETDREDEGNGRGGSAGLVSEEPSSREAGATAMVEGEVEGRDREEEEDEEEEWLLFNDFRVERTVVEDARGFDPSWKEPCVLVYRRVPPPSGTEEAVAVAAEASWRRALRERLAIPASVFDIHSLSKNLPVSQVVRLPPDQLPGKGDIVAIDAEFVSLMVEESRLRGDGSKVVTKHGRQSLARVSALDGRRSGSEASALVIMDDYVVQSEPVVDHLTRFSGITAEDLDPVTSRHNLHHLRTVYLRLRWLADAGCVFLGHGLDNDLRMFNLTLPPEQVIDTVNLWSLSGQRKVSLRFLAHYLLGINIQGETHDSIEDARIALALFIKYRSHVAAGTLSTALDALYKYGWEMGWKLDGGLTA